MLLKSEIKFIKSLSQKKHRLANHCFVVEGVKGIDEFLASDFRLKDLYTAAPIFESPKAQTHYITEGELKKISTLKTPNTALAVFEMPKVKPINTNGFVAVLDDVRDPGNLGTIIRLCDWFGVTELVCSHETVDCFNAKVVQATMGSLSRVNISYTDIKRFLQTSETTVYGTFMDGEDVYQAPLAEKGILVLGNEANGISKEVSKMVDKRIAIPRFGKLKATESLNVATATAIFLSEFKRRTTEK